MLFCRTAGNAGIEGASYGGILLALAKAKPGRDISRRRRGWRFLTPVECSPRQRGWQQIYSTPRYGRLLGGFGTGGLRPHSFGWNDAEAKQFIVLRSEPMIFASQMPEVCL